MFKNCLINRTSEVGAICTAQATQSSAQAVQRTAWPKPGWVDGGKGLRCQLRPTGWEFFSLPYPDWVIFLMQAGATLHYCIAAGACLNPPEILPILSKMSFMRGNNGSSRILILRHLCMAIPKMKTKFFQVSPESFWVTEWRLKIS